MPYAKVGVLYPSQAMLSPFQATHRAFQAMLSPFPATHYACLAMPRASLAMPRASLAMHHPFLPTHRPFLAMPRRFLAMLHAFAAVRYECEDAVHEELGDPHALHAVPDPSPGRGSTCVGIFSERGTS